jgi:hypothetical protein
MSLSLYDYLPCYQWVIQSLGHHVINHVLILLFVYRLDCVVAMDCVNRQLPFFKCEWRESEYGDRFKPLYRENQCLFSFLKLLFLCQLCYVYSRYEHTVIHA